MLPALAALGSLHANVTCTAQRNIDHKYNDVRQVQMDAMDLPRCCALCKAEPKCAIWVVTPNHLCWLKSAYGPPPAHGVVEAPGTVSMCTKAGAASCPDYKGDCSGWFGGSLGAVAMGPHGMAQVHVGRVVHLQRLAAVLVGRRAVFGPRGAEVCVRGGPVRAGRG